MSSSLPPPASVVSLSREQVFFSLISVSTANITNSLLPEPYKPIITLPNTEGVEEESLPKESKIKNAVKGAAGKAYEFASSVKDKLDDCIESQPSS